MKIIRMVIYCIAVMCFVAVDAWSGDWMSRMYQRQLEDMIMAFMPEALESGRDNYVSMLEDFGRYYIEELPGDFPTFPGWNFDIKGHELEQSKMLVETEDGIFLKNDDFRV